MTKNDKEEVAEPTENGDTGSKWIPLQRDYAHEIEQITVARVPATVHPLLGKEILTKLGANYRGAADVYRDIAEGRDPASPTQVSPVSSTPISPSNASYDDPLRSPTAAVAPKKTKVFDPLRALAAEEKKIASTPLASIPNVDPLPFSTTSTPTPEFEIWRDKRSRILTTYSTNKRIPVSANFLEEEEKEKKVVAVDNAKSRLEQLEMEQETEAAKNYMTQKEYITHIEEQLDKLRNAWENNERVVSLKIAIQCAKLLGDTSVPQFYPSMYVLLTEILDVFGDLVFNRIKKKGIDVIDPLTKQKVATSLPANFKASDVSLSAKETCRNWFYKTACIRELMPRLYIDLALIKSYRFLDDPDTFPALLARLSRTIRGIGDPLAAAYARAYLATKAGDLANSFTNDAAKAGEARSVPKEYQNVLLEAFDDFMFSFKDLSASNFSSIIDIKNEKISVDDYIDLYSPALEWILQNIGYKSTEDIFFALLQQHKDYCNNSMILVHIVASFDASFVSNHALDMTTLIKEATEIKAVPKSKLYLTLGRALVRRAPPMAQRLPILNDVWKVVTKIKEPMEYIEIAEIFVQYLLMNFTDREVNIFLKDVLKHIKKDTAYKQMQTQLANIVGNIMSLNKDLNKTLAMDNFLPILDLLEKSSKVIASKSVLVQFSKTGFKTSDPVIIHTLFDVARSLHDSVDSLSFEDERKQISALIVNCIRQIDFGRDLEQQLNFYVDCRQAFTNLDPVIAELVVRVALLAMSAHKFMKGNHSKKTSAFVKACLAYCHITIPSLDDIFSRLRLFLICGEVALVNQMIAQGEGFLKAAISLLPDVPPTIELYKRITSTEDDLVQYLRNFSSFLLLFPGHPEHGPFYLVKGLLNAIQSYPPWNNTVSVGKTRVYLGVLALFFAYYQRNFPVHIQGVESNDSLYGGDTAYIKQLQQFVDTLINEILAEITKIGDKGDLMSKKQQGTVALEFVNLLISGLTMNPQSATLVVKLYQLAVKTNAVDTSFLSSTLRHIQNKKGTWYSDIASKIQAATIAPSS